MTNTPWQCPTHPGSPASRDGDRSRCSECGQTDHPMDLPGVDRVLVVAWDIGEFFDFFRTWQTEAQFWLGSGSVRIGKTHYHYIRQRQSILGHDRTRTRHLVLGRRRANPELSYELMNRYAPAFPTRPAPEPGAGWVRIDELRSDPANDRANHQLDAIRYMLGSSEITIHPGQVPMEWRCLFQRQPVLNQQDLDQHRVVDWPVFHSPNEPFPGAGPTIGNPECRFNARSRFLRCAVRPDGPCEGCCDFEGRE